MVSNSDKQHFSETIQPPTTFSNNGSKSDDIVAIINGNFGRWQLRSVLLVFLCKIPSAWFMACVIYTAPTPQKGDYYCKPPTPPQTLSTIEAHQSHLNATSNSLIPWIRLSHPTVDARHTDRQFRVDACNIYEEKLEENFATYLSNYTNPFKEPDLSMSSLSGDYMNSSKQVNVIPCDTFEHHTEYKSLVTQFDLVCSRQLLVSATQSFHALGAFFGGILAFYALKRINPHRLMLLGMIGQIFCGNLTGLVATFQLHVYFRCLTSLFCALMYTSGQVILMDITDGTAKTIVTTLFELFWSIGLILLPCISIFFDSWSYLYLAISSSVIVLAFLHKWVTDSPRWLLRHNRIDEALQILLESATFNNREIPFDLERQLIEYAKELQQENLTTYWSIWDGKVQRKFLFFIHWAWLGAAVLFNVMLLMIRSLGIEYIHVNTASLGFAEMIGVLLGLYFILYTRHCWLWTGYLLLAASVFAFFVWLIPHTIKENRRIGIHMIFWIFLKLANSSTLSVLTTCTGNLIESKKRPLLLLSVATFSRLGLIIGPFISIFTVFSQLIPISIFAALAFVNALIMCFMNIYFWNDQQPRVPKVPTPNTYRRHSSFALLRRNSTISVAATSNGDSLNDCDNRAFSISIPDLWHMDLTTVNQSTSDAMDNKSM